MDDRVDTTILELCAARGRERSICPSEAARVLTPEDEDWRRMMPRVRQRAVALAREGRIEILRKGKPVADLAELKGVIRLRIAGDESLDRPSEPGGAVPHPSTGKDEALLTSIWVQQRPSW